MITVEKIGLQSPQNHQQADSDDYPEGSAINQYDDDDSISSIFDPDRENYYDVMHSLAMSWRDF